MKYSVHWFINSDTIICMFDGNLTEWKSFKKSAEFYFYANFPKEGRYIFHNNNNACMKNAKRKGAWVTFQNL
jgi:hypothetical protein